MPGPWGTLTGWPPAAVRSARGFVCIWVQGSCSVLFSLSKAPPAKAPPQALSTGTAWATPHPPLTVGQALRGMDEKLMSPAPPESPPQSARAVSSAQDNASHSRLDQGRLAALLCRHSREVSEGDP